HLTNNGHEGRAARRRRNLDGISGDNVADGEEVADDAVFAGPGRLHGVVEQSHRRVFTVDRGGSQWQLQSPNVAAASAVAPVVMRSDAVLVLDRKSVVLGKRGGL